MFIQLCEYVHTLSHCIGEICVFIKIKATLFLYVLEGKLSSHKFQREASF